MRSDLPGLRSADCRIRVSCIHGTFWISIGAVDGIRIEVSPAMDVRTICESCQVVVTGY